MTCTEGGANSGKNRPKTLSHRHRRLPSLVGSSGKSGLTVLGVPEQLEVGDQRRTEVAVGLLAGIERGVLAEQVERLGGETQRPAIADGADRARAGQPVDHASDRRVDLR